MEVDVLMPKPENMLGFQNTNQKISKKFPTKVKKNLFELMALTEKKKSLNDYFPKPRGFSVDVFESLS